MGWLLRAKTGVLIVGGGMIGLMTARQRRRCAVNRRATAVPGAVPGKPVITRLGITLATGTARLMAEMMCGSALSLPADDFALPQAA